MNSTQPYYRRVKMKMNMCTRFSFFYVSVNQKYFFLLTFYFSELTEFVIELETFVSLLMMNTVPSLIAR